MLAYKDQACELLDSMLTPKPPKPEAPVSHGEEPQKPVQQKIIKPYNRQILFEARRLESEADIDAYVEKVRSKLKTLLQGCDGIQLK